MRYILFPEKKSCLIFDFGLTHFYGICMGYVWDKYGKWMLSHIKRIRKSETQMVTSFFALESCELF